jgi:hypothetical protein
MKRSDRDAWVADLRANPLIQGRRRLSCSTGDCCLGRLALLHKVQYVVDPEGTKMFLFDRNFLGEDAIPPKAWLNGIDLPWSTAKLLACMNDSGKSFSEIADEIERIVPVTED